MADASNRGALISADLAALVHVTIGSARGTDSEDCVKLGFNLIDEIQEELNRVWREAVKTERSIHSTEHRNFEGASAI